MSAAQKHVQLIERYIAARDTRSDINEHLPVLMDLAAQCESVVELGVRTVVSSWAFAAGLALNGKEEKRLVGVDLRGHPNVAQFAQAVAGLVQHEFWEGDDLKYDCDPVDMVFIDTFHHYRQMEAELEKYGPLARKWIVGHDCQSDRYTSEILRCPTEYDIHAVSRQTGWSVKDLAVGIWPAVTEFLEKHPEWILEHEYQNCNGLFILRRVENE